MKALFKYHYGKFIPLMDSDLQDMKIEQFQQGEIYQLEYSKPRNVMFHRKYFAMLWLAFENQETFEDFESFRQYVLIKIGHKVQVKTERGLFIRAKSISFAKLSESDFKQIYDKTLDFLVRKFFDESFRTEVISQLNEF